MEFGVLPSGSHTRSIEPWREAAMTLTIDLSGEEITRRRHRAFPLKNTPGGSSAWFECAAPHGRMFPPRGF